MNMLSILYGWEESRKQITNEFFRENFDKVQTQHFFVEKVSQEKHSSKRFRKVSKQIAP